MKTKLKNNIWIEGFDTYQQFISSKLLDEYDIIYMGKTSKIHEELAEECVEKIYTDFDLFAYKDYQNGVVENSDNSLTLGFVKAKKSIKSAITKPDGKIYPYCIIYEQ